MLSKYIIAVAALGLTTLASAQQPCDLKISLCPYDQLCVPDPNDCTDPNDPNRWRGTCRLKNKYTSCGGVRVQPVACDANSECRDDPRLPESCGLACGIPGICMPKKPRTCAGFAGFVCPKGLFCYDVPNDGCDPKNGVADCLGLCL